MNYQDFSSPKDLNSRRTQFTLRFIQALARIKMATTSSSRISPTLIGSAVHQRSRKIKLASDASMASTVGSRRLWSRSMLLKIKNRARLHGLKMASLRKKKKKKIKKMKMRRKVGSKNDESGCERLGRTADLRRLIPGGEAMEFCRLLEETADYIKCLNTQVQVMQRIADVYTS